MEEDIAAYIREKYRDLIALCNHNVAKETKSIIYIHIYIYIFIYVYLYIYI